MLRAHRVTADVRGSETSREGRRRARIAERRCPTVGARTKEYIRPGSPVWVDATEATLFKGAARTRRLREGYVLHLKTDPMSETGASSDSLRGTDPGQQYGGIVP